MLQPGQKPSLDLEPRGVPNIRQPLDRNWVASGRRGPGRPPPSPPSRSPPRSCSGPRSAAPRPSSPWPIRSCGERTCKFRGAVARDFCCVRRLPPRQAITCSRRNGRRTTSTAASADPVRRRALLRTWRRTARVRAGAGLARERHRRWAARRRGGDPRPSPRPGRWRLDLRLYTSVSGHARPMDFVFIAVDQTFHVSLYSLVALVVSAC